MSRRRIVIVSILWCAIASMVSAQQNIEWFNSGSPTPAIDPTGSAIVSGADGTSGALFQLIKAAAGVSHAPTSADFGTGYGVQGGDEFVGWTFANSSFGNGIAYAKETYQSLAAAGTDYIYVRIWTLPSSGSGNLNVAPDGMYYFDTPTVQVNTLPYDGTFYADAFTPPDQSSSWTFLAIPEPSTMALGLLGFGMVMVRRFMKKK
jgi:hypothetical protein